MPDVCLSNLTFYYYFMRKIGKQNKTKLIRRQQQQNLMDVEEIILLIKVKNYKSQKLCMNFTHLILSYFFKRKISMLLFHRFRFTDRWMYIYIMQFIYPTHDTLLMCVGIWIWAFHRETHIHTDEHTKEFISTITVWSMRACVRRTCLSTIE